MKRNYSEDEVEELKKSIIEEHGSMERLRKNVSRYGCRNPGMVDDYILVDFIEKGADLRYEVINSSPKALASLTPKRVELLSFIKENEVESITELSNKINRDYKNVYDDLRALSSNGIILLEKNGKKQKPVVKAEIIEIKFS